MTRIVFGVSECALCRQVITYEEEDGVVATRDVFPPTDPLWPYANVVMHARCFFTWEKRDAFLLGSDVCRSHSLSENFTRIIGLERCSNRPPRVPSGAAHEGTPGD